MASLITAQPTITRGDLDDVTKVVDGAMAMGWIDAQAEVRLKDSNGFVNIEIRQGSVVLERRYAHAERWILKFLRELSEGSWRPPSDTKQNEPA